MINSITIQKKNNNFINASAYACAEGASMLGLNVEFFENIDDVVLNKTKAVHGFISVVNKALIKLNCKIPNIEGFPQEILLPFYGRNMCISTLGELRFNERKCFIKPLNESKLFTGHVRGEYIASLVKTASLPDDTEIIVSDVVNFISEYRLFIHRGLIVGCQYYRGDFSKYIDFDVVEQIVAAYQKPPVAYSLDMGATDDGRTLIVEINDAYSLNSYGLAPIRYTRLIVDRWSEMVGILGD